MLSVALLRAAAEVGRHGEVSSDGERAWLEKDVTLLSLVGSVDGTLRLADPELSLGGSDAESKLRLVADKVVSMLTGLTPSSSVVAASEFAVACTLSLFSLIFVANMGNPSDVTPGCITLI